MRRNDVRFPILLVAMVVVSQVSLTSLVPVAVSAEPRRPNVVVFLTDDQGWGDLSVNGNTNLSTLNIDSLAKDGVKFDRFFVCPVCSPTRAEFLTGRYHSRGGVVGVSTGGERLDLDERTIADVFAAAGYRTGAFGKWHNGSQYPYHPNGRGFQEYYGFTSGHWGDYFSPPLEHNGHWLTGNGFLADDLTDRALAFMEANRDRPFFCYVPYNTPHSPMQVPDRFYEKFRDVELKLTSDGRQKEDVAMTRAALAMCENIDWNVGRVLRKLDQWKLAKDTIVLYFCDNGPNGARWNGGMKGRKGSTDEGGVRSPLLIRWPARIAGGKTIAPIAGAIDLLPTLAELANIPIKNTKPLDGRSFAPVLLGELPDWAPRTLFSTWNGKVSARTQRWRLDAEGQLFDMQADPNQTRDVASQHADVAEQLKREVADWKQTVLAEAKKDARPFPVGHREFPLTRLPARDGVGHGTIRRSAAAPNCSFFTHWTREDDSITWDVEVATAGRYEVSILQTCAAENVGVTIEMEFAGKTLRREITAAHDPPLVGDGNDRVPRKGESLVKDFRPVTLGEIELPTARGAITLRAHNLRGGKAIDLRAMDLRLTK